MNKYRTWSVVGCLLVGLVFGLSILPGAGGAARNNPDQEPSEVPRDTAIVELEVPPGAKVLANGQDVGPKRRLNYRCKPGQIYSLELRVQFKEGDEARRTVLLQGGWLVRVPLTHRDGSLPELVAQTGHADVIAAVAFSPDGKLVLTGSGDRSAILWEASTGKKLRAFYPHSGFVLTASFSPDGRQVLLGGDDGKASLWQVQTGKKLLTFQGPAGLVLAAVFSPDGNQVLTGSADSSAILWDRHTGQKLRIFAGHTDRVYAVAFSPDGKQVLTGSADRSAILWDAQTGRKLRTFQGHAQGILAVAYHRDGRQVLTGAADNSAAVWDAQTGQKLRALGGHTNWVSAVAFSADGKHALTGSWDQTAILWDVRSWTKISTLRGHKEQVLAVAFSRDGTRAATGSWDQTAVLWESPSGKKLRTLKGHTDRVWSIAFSADGKQAVTGSGDKFAILWEPLTGRQQRIFHGHTGRILSVVFSPDGKQVLTGSEDKTARLWDAETGQNLQTLKGHTDGIWSVKFSPDGRQVLTGGADKKAILWDAQTGQKLRMFEGHTARLWEVAFSPDGKQMLSAADDGSAGLWDVQTGRKLRTLQGHAGPVLCVSFSPDGKQVLTTGKDKLIILWEAQTGRKLKTYEGHTEGAGAAFFRPDGKTFVSCSYDGTICLWDASSGLKLRTFREHTGPVDGLALSPDGRYLLSSGGDGTARFTDMATGDELATLISLDQGRQWLAATPEGLFDGSVGGRRNVTFRVGSGLNVVPVDRFFQDFYRPGLLAALWRGERLLPKGQLGASQAPLVKLLAPTADGPVEANRVTLEVEVLDQGGGIKGPWLTHNGARVLGVKVTKVPGTTVRRRFTVDLVEGANRLEVQAASSDGSMESEPAARTLRYEQPSDKGTLYVVAVGINRYAEDSLRLKFAQADAQALADLFRRRGSPLYRDVRIYPLLDEQATTQAITGALDEVARLSRPGDTLVVFLAGHGIMVDGQYYFIPHEFRRTAGKPLEEEVRTQGLSGEALGKHLGAVQALQRVLVFDTCQSGGAVNLTKTAQKVFDFRGEVERLSRGQGVYALAASAFNDEAQEVGELGHGVLTYTLLAGLRAVNKGPLQTVSVQPSDPKQVADVVEWFTFASGQVRRLTRQFGRPQEPVLGISGSGFPVLPVTDP